MHTMTKLIYLRVIITALLTSLVLLLLLSPDHVESSSIKKKLNSAKKFIVKLFSSKSFEEKLKLVNEKNDPKLGAYKKLLQDVISKQKEFYNKPSDDNRDALNYAEKEVAKEEWRLKRWYQKAAHYGKTSLGVGTGLAAYGAGLYAAGMAGKQIWQKVGFNNANQEWKDPRIVHENDHGFGFNSGSFSFIGRNKTRLEGNSVDVDKQSYGWLWLSAFVVLGAVLFVSLYYVFKANNEADDERIGLNLKSSANNGDGGGKKSASSKRTCAEQSRRSATETTK